MNSILSIVPYRILPPVNGGKLTITEMHHHLGQLCRDTIAGTADNDDNTNYAFRLHKIFSTSKLRYLPFSGYAKLLQIAHENAVNYIHTEHHYMGFKALKLARALSIPCFIRSHNIESERFKSLGKSWWPIMRWYERYVMRKADGVFFITPEDAQWAIHNYQLQPSKCHFIPHGTPLAAAPFNHTEKKQELSKALNLDGHIPWLYFLGALDYPPNNNAIVYILDEILPRLDAQGCKYQLLIAGKGLSPSLQQRISALPQARYVGFVPNLNDFLTACDIMLNPVMTGGGIKTKAVEALAYNKIVLSSAAGAAGLAPGVCGDNLHIIPDYDWNRFAEKLLSVMRTNPTIPQDFYNTYNWNKIAERMLQIMSSTTVR